MTTASWCVLVALVISQACCAIARLRARRRGDPGDVRRACERSDVFGTPRADGWDARRNAFQSLALFAASVLIAQQTGAPQAWVDGLALAWMAVRIAHAAFHLAGRPSLRTLAQAASLGCVLGLFVGSAMAERSNPPARAGSRIARSAAALRF